MEKNSQTSCEINDGKRGQLSLSGQGDVRHRKYKLSSSSTPSPSEENKEFINGFYQKNIKSVDSNHLTNGAEKKNNAGVDNLAFQDDNVFSVSKDLYYDPKSLERKRQSHKRVESAREESVGKKKIEKGCLILLCLLTVLGLLAGIAVILYFKVFKVEESSSSTISTLSLTQTTLASPVILVGSIKLNNDWKEELSNSSSQLYKDTASNFTKEFDGIMQNGNISQFYNRVVLLGFSQGSVLAHLELFFHPTYKSLYKNEDELAASTEFLIIEAYAKGQTALQILCANITGGQTSPSTSTCTTTAEPTTTTEKPSSIKTTAQSTSQPVVSFSTSETSTEADKTSTQKPTTSLPPSTSIKETSTTVTSEQPSSILPASSTVKTTTSIDTTSQLTTRTTTSQTTTTTKSTTGSTTSKPTTVTTSEPTSTTTPTTVATNQPSTSVSSTTTTVSSSVTPTSTPIVPTTPKSSTPAAVCVSLQVPECQALGRSTAIFPNVFNHSSIAQAVPVFQLFKNQSCSQSSLYYLCNFLFPPCEGPSLPCSDTCRKVQSECGATFQLATETYCSQLPSTNCYGYDLPTSSTQMTESTTASIGLCMTLRVPECQAVGHTDITFPNAFNHPSIESALPFFEQYKKESCSPASMYYLCNMLFPSCNVTDGHLSYPCQQHCQEINTECPGLTVAQSLYCDQLPITSCIESLPSSTTTKPEKCLTLSVPECEAVGHTSVKFPNAFNHQNISEALPYFNEYKKQSCSQNSTFYLCNFLFPSCDADTGSIQYPCKDHCTDINHECPGLLLANVAYCNQLPNTSCIDSRKPDLCTTLAVPECQNLGHTKVRLPNAFGHQTVDEVMQYFNTFKQQSCSNNSMYYICNFLFPSCNSSTGLVTYPCQDHCLAMNAECGSNFQLASINYCSQLPVSDCVPSLTPLLSTTTTLQPSVTSKPSTSATTPAELCTTLAVPECQNLGHTKVRLPNAFGHQTVDEVMQYFNTFKQQSCSDNSMYYICNFLFPSCNSSTGLVTYPCQDHCLGINAECGSNFQLASINYCSQLPVSDCVPSLTPLPSMTTTLQPSVTSKPSTSATTPAVSCMTLEVPECQAVGHTLINLPNAFGHRSVEAVMPYFDLYKKQSCSQVSMFYLCNFLFPGCDPTTGYTQVPCRDHCQAVQDECGPEFVLASKTYCDQLPQDNSFCVKKYNGSTITTTAKAVTTTTPIKTTTVKQNCSLTGQHTCPNGKCIMMEWLCDGEPDCDDRSDETNCSKCSDVEFTCLDSSCVPASERCNKVPACPDQSDERDCLMINAYNKQLEVMINEFRLPLCFQSWSNDYGPLVCQTLGLGNFTQASPLVAPSHKYAVLDQDGLVISYLGNLSSSSTCEKNEVVTVKCEPRGCGQRLIGSSQVQYIIGGNDALPGYWPWQVSIQLEAGSYKAHTCGASLISPNFVLTATHCLKYLVSNDLRSLLLGATNRVTNEVTQKKYSIQRIINYNSTFKEYGPGDISLFELTNPVEYTPYIQPICLPEPTEEFSETSICYATGWGYTSPGENIHSERLKELKMKIWKLGKCNGTAAWNGSVTDGYLCAGYESGIKSVCTGDSGGPLACKDNAGIWKLVGISSYVSTNCNKASKPNVFTDVKQYLPWIKKQIECKFECDNGKCIYDINQLCNKEDNCGDNSDEIKPCNISVSCSFDDSFLCGYNARGFTLESGPKNSQAKSTIPWSDHTIGHYPGHYLVGKVGTDPDAVLTSPKFRIYSQSCVKFYYNIRGQVQKTLFVRALEYSSKGNSTSRLMWNSVEGDMEDSWKLGHFDLSAGEYQLTFTIFERMLIALDDIEVVTGLCSTSVCGATSYRCSNNNAAVCVPNSGICNVVKDCNKDEQNCQVENTRYDCDFESAVHCGISQVTEDNGEWLLVNGSYLKEKILFDLAFNDHTSNQPSGWMFFAFTNLLRQVSNSIKITQKLYLNNLQHCLSFFYQSKTEMTFKVSLESGGTLQTLWNFTDRITVGWTKAQIQLPALNDAVVTYELVRTSAVIHNYFKPFIALDDISIQPGLCPTYECPTNWTKCNKEDYCYPPENRCDRKVHCQDESDEAQCDCTEKEFACSNGRCIDKSLTCNAKADCLDKSDEGSVCAPYRKVSCDFESPFICGYTPTSLEFTWLRHSGATPSFFTGPSADHTTGDSTGYYMYAEGNNGLGGDLATLTSPVFTSTSNQSLSFFYHIQTESIGVKTESEGLSVITWFTTLEKNQTWWTNETTGNKWKYACTDLPADKEMVIQFIAKRKGLDSKGIYDADVAIDDVVLRNTTCAGVSPEPTSTTVTTTETTGCAADQFTCNNGFCIQKTSVCDFISDCRNGEDELNCPSK